MPDAFFQKKRKRPAGASGGASSAGAARTSKGKQRARDDGGDQSASDAEGPGGIEDIDFRHRYDDVDADDAARRTETHAQARVRMAKAYLDGLKAEQQVQNGK